MSQAVEQVARIVCGIWLVSRFLGLGLEKAVTGASFATVAGETVGFAYRFAYLLLRFKATAQPLKARFSSRAAGRLLTFGLPVTLGRLAASAIAMLQAFLIPLCLQKAGWDMRAATEMYGRFAGVAMALIHLPGVFTSALAVSVMPAVAETASGGQLLKRRVGHSLQAASVFTFPGMLLLFFFADELTARLFHNPLAAPLVRILAVGGCFFHLQVTLVSVLQGLGEVKALLINNLLSGLILLFGIVMLTAQPALGIRGAALAADVAWASGFILNLSHFLRASHLRFDWANVLLKPSLAALAAGAIYLLLRAPLAALLPGASSLAGILLSMAMLSLAYVLLLMLSHGLHMGLWSRIKKR